MQNLDVNLMFLLLDFIEIRPKLVFYNLKFASTAVLSTAMRLTWNHILFCGYAASLPAADLVIQWGCY